MKRKGPRGDDATEPPSKFKSKFPEENPEAILAVEDDFIFRDGLRLVKPYFFDYFASVKRRWAGKSIADVFSSEFGSRSREYYEEAIKLVSRPAIDVEAQQYASSHESLATNLQRVFHSP